MILFSCIFLLIIFLVISNIIRETKLLEKEKKLLETVTKSDRGTATERNLVLKLLKAGIPAQTIFHDLYIKTYSNHYSQIDLVVATKVGILVFEVKKYSGWIFGTGYQPRWTQVLAYGKTKYQFYNPIMQNNKHIVDLRRQLGQFENIPFYSIVIFYGDCIFKNVSYIPDGTFLVKSRRVFEIIKNIIENNRPAPYTNKSEIVRVLKQAVKNGESKEIQYRHIENIKSMLSKN